MGPSLDDRETLVVNFESTMVKIAGRESGALQEKSGFLRFEEAVRRRSHIFPEILLHRSEDAEHPDAGHGHGPSFPANNRPTNSLPSS